VLPASFTSRPRYEVLTRIACGGMATVYAGRASNSSEVVAIKYAHPFVLADRDLLGCVEEEARLVAGIRHPNVVSLLDFTWIGRAPVLVLEYVEGATFRELQTRLTSRRAPERWAIALRVALDTAAGLSAAHAGCVHHDVTPHNVLVGTDGVSRLTDFGIALAHGSSHECRDEEMIKGKLGYLPPEYLAGRDFTAQGDQFSLAVLIWEALADKALFGGHNAHETMRLVLDAQVPLLAEHDARLAALDPVLGRALAADPAERYPSVAEFARALEAAGVTIASAADVAEAVATAFEKELATRRDEIERSPAVAVADRLAFSARVPRDDVATRSITRTRRRRRRKAI
jgi:serine/threonine protein kinase